jgi:hypothetical protein
MIGANPLRRPLKLLVVLLLAVAAAVALERRRPTVPPEPPVLGIRADHVTAVRVQYGPRELRAKRDGSSWRVEAPSPAGRAAPAAVAELVVMLADLVATDTFERPELDRRTLGLAPARARIELETRGAAEPVVLLLGDYVPTGGSVYCALSGDSRIHQVGALLVTEIEKAFYRATETQQDGDRT